MDGNKYLDYISALGSVSVGYGNNYINKRVINNLKNGNCFSLSHPKEISVANRLIKLIPSAEMVRFGKNGTDVNSAAIRLARHVTKKCNCCMRLSRLARLVYNSTPMNSGIPNEVKKFTKKFQFNDIESLSKILSKNKCAAVIMEPLSYQLPKKKFFTSKSSM